MTEKNHPPSKPSSVLDSLLEYERKGGKMLFWVCPKSCQGFVEWEKTAEGYVATCKTCGTKSEPRQPR